MAAHRLLAAGARVLMLERGEWIARGPEAWRPEASLELTPAYAKDIPYRCDTGGHGTTIGGYACVGGPSVYYGCVAFRFRERDFVGDPGVVADSGAAWPFRYDELEPYYAEAERLLRIAGDDAGDPTAPRRSAPYPFAPAPLAQVSAHVVDSAVALGLSPFHLPLAIDHARCARCRTCDTYACAIEAKNDVATTMIRPLVARGLALVTGAVATRIEDEAGRVRAVHVIHKATGEREVIAARHVVLAAGALGSAHLALASRLDERSPARAAVGRYLMRHDNAMIFGFYGSRPDRERRFHKQVALHDWYFGAPPGDEGGDGSEADAFTKLGGVQQMMTPPVELVRAHLPRPLRALASFSEHLTGLLCIAEDQPRLANGCTVDWNVRDAYGLPQLVIDHTYSTRDRAASNALVRRARRVLDHTGAITAYTHRVKTFSHAVGTLRMGTDPATSPLDAACQFRGVANLWVTDGAALPMSAGVNPSLTIAANALRAAEAIVATA
ncbi:MAG TPA: GMC family oxidoreductase [Kofleriaceae bacterium]|nr:GMC family oxidoreductase [Kofleriaceae bacterium]